jgi:hypothetical protein
MCLPWTKLFVRAHPRVIDSLGLESSNKRIPLRHSLKHFYRFLHLPSEIQQKLSTFCNAHSLRTLRATCHIIRECINEHPSTRHVPRGNIGFALRRRYFPGPWESEVAFNTIMNELSPYIDVTIFQHPQHLMCHMIANNAHPNTIQLFQRMNLMYFGTVTLLPDHSEQRDIFTYIYRYRRTIDYV